MSLSKIERREVGSSALRGQCYASALLLKPLGPDDSHPSKASTTIRTSPERVGDVVEKASGPDVLVASGHGAAKRSVRSRLSASCVH